MLVNQDKSTGKLFMSRLMPSQLTPELELMLASAIERKYPAKDFIVRAGEKPISLYFITEGSVTVYVEDDTGDELILAYLGPGKFFGELGLFGNKEVRSAWIRARTDCKIASISYDKFHALCKENHELWMQLGGQIADRLRETSSKLGQLAFLDVTGRVARAILDLAKDSEAITHPDGMMIKISREELGKIVNCSREMAGKVLKNLEGQGLLQIDGRSIVVNGTR